MRLIVCLEGQIAGMLESSGSRASFTYSEGWVDASGSYPLSQSLPLQPAPITGARVLNFLWGLLPDNERTLDAWARRFQVSARNPVALLAHVGEDCAGAVQFVTEGRLDEVLDGSNRPPRVAWLDHRELEERIRRLAHDGAAGRATAQEGQFSLAGAQSKTALYFDTQRKSWGVPEGRTPTTHILKPLANDFDGFAENEHFCLTLARRVALAAARSEWRQIGGIPTLIVERYDRVQLHGRWHRIHQEDCCQALGVHPGSKYESDGGPGFPKMMALLDGVDEPEVDRERMMRAACFNYFAAASDAHAKNFSLLYARGVTRPSLRLAPLYDIASAWPYARRIPLQKIKLAMRVGKHYRLREILPRHFAELARACRFPADRIMDTLSELARTLPDEASTVAREMSSTKGMAQPVLKRLVDGIARQSAVVAGRLART